MPLKFIHESVDIYQHPDPNHLQKAVQGTEITIGDLHGNAMKLMFMLVRHGIATNITKAQYQKLVQIYETSPALLTQNDLNQFNQILSEIEFSNKALVRLIGDELADRGQNDYFTLKILQKLKKHQVPVEIIVSNHGIEFIEACEPGTDSNRSRLDQRQARSMANLQILVDKNLVTREEIIEIADSSYKPTLKAISYSLSEDQNEITIYSHAAIGLNTIKSLAEKLGVEYQDTTTRELAQTIDNINNEFQVHVKNNTVHTLYYGTDSDNQETNPFRFIMWNRYYGNIVRPVENKGYQLNYVHGHDSNDPKNDNHLFNLDNELGKGNENEGEYTALISRPLLLLIQEIEDKTVDLKKNGHLKATYFAQRLHQELVGNYQKFTNNEIDSETFKKNCIEAIQQNRSELEKHRGWKQILGNLVLAVVGVGVIYVAAGLINKALTGNFLFFKKTDSAHKIDQLEQSIQSINRPMGK